LKSDLYLKSISENKNIEQNTTNGSQIALNGFKYKKVKNIAILNNQADSQNKITKSIVPQNQHKLNSDFTSNADAVEIVSKENVQKLNQPEQEIDSNKVDRIAIVGFDTSKKTPAIAKSENDTLEIEKAKITKLKPFDFLKTWKYRLGVNGEFAHEQMGVGLMGEILFKPRWSIAMGIKKGMISSDHFKDDNEYFMHKSRDFRSEYASNYNSSTNISNIDFQYALLQLPITLSYRFPLKKNLNLIGSVGTELDLSVRQMVKYESKMNLEMPKTNSTESVRQGMTLNTGILALGVEAQIKKHFVAQISPYVLTTFKLNEYRDEPISVGMRMRLYYQF
jgi:hypothetical protein